MKKMMMMLAILGMSTFAKAANLPYSFSISSVTPVNGDTSVNGSVIISFDIKNATGGVQFVSGDINDPGVKFSTHVNVGAGENMNDVEVQIRQQVYEKMTAENGGTIIPLLNFLKGKSIVVN